jgi:hypothetical protein
VLLADIAHVHQLQHALEMREKMIHTISEKQQKRAEAMARPPCDEASFNIMHARSVCSRCVPQL